MPNIKETNESVPTKKTTRPKEMPYNQAVTVLVIGDAICFLIFAAIGRSSHGEASGFAAIPQVITTALPFAIAWFLVSPFVGAYRRENVAQPRAMVTRTALAWLLSWPVAMLLRGIFVDHRIPPYTFAIIALLSNLVLLLVWRWPFALNNSMRKRGVGI